MSPSGRLPITPFIAVVNSQLTGLKLSGPRATAYFRRFRRMLAMYRFAAALPFTSRAGRFMLRRLLALARTTRFFFAPAAFRLRLR